MTTDHKFFIGATLGIFCILALYSFCAFVTGLMLLGIILACAAALIPSFVIFKILKSIE